MIEYQLPRDSNTIPIQNAYGDLTAKYANNAAGDIEYIGKAEIGSSPASSVWQIKKLEYDASAVLTSIVWADSTRDFVNTWDSRTGYSYG